jgi:hypothetical protein
MKVQIAKNVLTNVLDKMYSCATKALFPEFNNPGKVTVNVQKNKVLFTTSNGFIVVNQTIDDIEDPNIANCEPGICTVDAIKFRDSVKNIKTQAPASAIELFDDGQVLQIRDTDSKRKKLVKLPRESQAHASDKVKRPDGQTFHFETEHFVKGVTTVAPFKWPGSYDPKFQVILFHWLAKETRFICADGSVFAVFNSPRSSKDKSKAAVERTILCDQALVAVSLVEGSQTMEMVWEDKDSLWIKAGNVELIIKGQPDVNYTKYESHAYRHEEAKSIMDIKIEDLSEVNALLRVLRDKEREGDQLKCHSCFVHAPSSDGLVKFEITADQGKFQCEYEVPCVYYDVNNYPVHSKAYAHLWLDTISAAVQHDYLRFYFIGDRTVNVRDADLGDPDQNGIPQIKDEPDSCSLHFFFAAIRENIDEGEE